MVYRGCFHYHHPLFDIRKMTGNYEERQLLLKMLNKSISFSTNPNCKVQIPIKLEQPHPFTYNIRFTHQTL